MVGSARSAPFLFDGDVCLARVLRKSETTWMLWELKELHRQCIPVTDQQRKISGAK